MGLRRRHEEALQPRWLEVDASMTGTLAFKDPVNLQINGQFEGTLDARGNLAIGEQARVRATIRGEQISVGGSVEGSLIATKRLELLPSARVTGKIAAPKLIVHDGALLHGTCEMLAEQGPGAWMTLEELARYLEIESATVLEWVQAGRLPAQQDGGQWRFERTRIEDWLAQERIK